MVLVDSQMTTITKKTVTPPDIAERLLSGLQIGMRWSCHPKVAYARAIKLGARPIRFNARTVKFRLSDIIRIEEEATAEA